MTPRESEIMELIKKTPTITQQEIADILNIKRSSVAVHINNLAKQGYILGRRYIFKEEPNVMVIGGANIDIIGYPTEKILSRDSSPGKITRTGGGVARNIAENLAKLGVPTSFIGAFGDDESGRLLISDLNEKGVKTDESLIIQGKQTSTYVAILDDKRDMAFAINDMEIANSITPETLFKKKKKIENSNIVVIDTNLPKQTINYLLKDISQKYYIDCVSVNKADKIKDVLKYIHFIKANKYEAEFLSDTKIVTIEDAKNAAKKLVDLGVTTVVVTLGEEGLVYADKKEIIHLKGTELEIVNATGAGDAFMGGYIYGEYNGLGLMDKLKFALACSRVVLKSKKTTLDILSISTIEEELVNVK